MPRVRLPRQRDIRVLYADPPWSYNDTGYGTRDDTGNYNPNYDLMPLKDIIGMAKYVKSITAENSACCLWVPSPLLDEGLEVLEAWGYEFKTILFVWLKTTSIGRERWNLGHWTLSNVEIVLLGTRGKIKAKSKRVRQVVVAPVAGHSRKPAEVRRRIDVLFGDCRKLELFAREKHKGWEAWGNQVGVFDDKPFSLWAAE